MLGVKLVNLLLMDSVVAIKDSENPKVGASGAELAAGVARKGFGARITRKISKENLANYYRENLFSLAPYAGALVGLYFYVASWGSSLLPRNWAFQALITGACTAFGFGIGAVAGVYFDLIRRQLKAKANPKVVQVLQVIFWGFVTAVVLIYPWFTRKWQVMVAQRVGMKPIGYLGVGLAIVGSVLVFALLVSGWRKLSRICAKVAKKLGKRTNVVLAWVAGVLSSFGMALLILVLVVQIGLTLVQNVFFNSFYQEETWLKAPTSSLKSGSAESYEKWEDLGSQGRSFVAKGATKEKIASVTGKPAKEPIRVYAGLNGRSVDQVADAAVAEMVRTGAFDRKYLMISTTTGSGNVNHWAATSFEYLTGGDCAIVGIQHSRVPSAFQFLSDRQAVVYAANELFQKVYAKLDQMPADSRPKVYLNAESIGAFGATTMFASFDAMASRVDGAVFMGTPEFSPMTQALTSQRSIWATPFSPVVNDGRIVRFVADGNVDARPDGSPYQHWRGASRVIFLGHESDPITRWDWKLAWQRPSWLAYERPGTIAEPMVWQPVVTFLQVGIDMASSMGTPPNRGHLYHSEDLVPAWGAVLGVEDESIYPAVIAAVDEQHGR